MKIEKNFKYIFNSSWTEDVLLRRFRLQVLKNPKLYNNNNFIKAQPIKIVYSFHELINYIQLFNFEKNNYPLYYTIALCLKIAYDNNKNLDTPQAIIFETNWTICSESDKFKYEHELPFDDNIYWSYTTDYLKKHEWLWTNKEQQIKI